MAGAFAFRRRDGAGLGRLSGLKAIDAAHEQAAQQAETLWEQLGPALVRERKSKAPRIPVLVAAAIGAAGILFASGVFGPPAAYFAEYRTSTGEVRRVTLKDGSQVDLDSGTSFDVTPRPAAQSLCMAARFLWRSRPIRTGPSRWWRQTAPRRRSAPHLPFAAKTTLRR